MIAAADPPQPPASVKQIELAGAFKSRSPWRLVVVQGPPGTDFGDNPAPGPIKLCLLQNSAGPCDAKQITPPLSTGASSDGDWVPHYLEVADPVYPQGRSGPPLLEVVTASLHAGDGGQLRVTQLLKYDAGQDVFKRIYIHSTGTNNNQSVRFVTKGPLMGDVISAEPTSDEPYAYWVTVNQLTPARTYRQVLRFRSATTYGDGNRLAVIDSEMPNILGRLGLWRPGKSLPLPPGGAKACARPHLKGLELWCD